MRSSGSHTQKHDVTEDQVSERIKWYKKSFADRPNTEIDVYGYIFPKYQKRFNTANHRLTIYANDGEFVVSRFFHLPGSEVREQEVFRSKSIRDITVFTELEKVKFWPPERPEPKIRTTKRNIPIDLLTLPDGWWEEDPGGRDSIERLKEKIESGVPIDAIQLAVGENGDTDFTDGRHRWQAYKELGFKYIEVEVNLSSWHRLQHFWRYARKPGN